VPRAYRGTKKIIGGARCRKATLLLIDDGRDAHGKLVYGSGCVAEDGEEGAGTCDSFGSETNGLARRTDLRCASPA
jgi:hypothetical protein